MIQTSVNLAEPITNGCTAFSGSRLIASGELKTVALKVKALLDKGEPASVLIFDNLTSEIVEVDFRGTAESVLKKIGKDSPNGEAADQGKSARGLGRPKLGVVAREVTLLPRHWEWLGNQPGGASVALRKLVENARKTHSFADGERKSREATYRFISAMAGNEPGFEEATRALFAGDQKSFNLTIKPWPADIQTHARKLASPSFKKHQL